MNNSAKNYGGGVCVDMDPTSIARVTVGSIDQGNTTPDISSNISLLSGGGLYVKGSKANVTINSGRIDDNTVAAYVKNENVANEGGLVTLNGGEVTHVIVTFNRNVNQDGSDETYSQKIVTNTNSNLTKARFTRSGYTFDGWNTHPKGLGTNYTDEQVMNISGDITLYAKWRSQ